MQFSPHPGNRPDLTAASTPMFRESGVDLTNNKQSFNDKPAPLTQRPEMRGPQTSPDIDQLLSGLKPKRQVETVVQPPPPTVDEMPIRGSESIVSLSSLKDLDGTIMPKKTTKRRNTSEKNTVVLDL